MFEERTFGRFIRGVKSLWGMIARDRRSDPEAELTVIPLYAPQAYPDGFPFGKPAAREIDAEDRENGKQ